MVRKDLSCFQSPLTILTFHTSYLLPPLQDPTTGKFYYGVICSRKDEEADRGEDPWVGL